MEGKLSRLSLNDAPAGLRQAPDSSGSRRIKQPFLNHLLAFPHGPISPPKICTAGQQLMIQGCQPIPNLGIDMVNNLAGCSLAPHFN